MLAAVETWPTQQRNKNFVRMALSSSFFASEQSAIVTKPSGGRIVVSLSAPVHVKINCVPPPPIIPEWICYVK
jgi:hypothetical protein